jgi:ElaA protein
MPYRFTLFQFNALSTPLLYAILALREHVFVVEQNAVYTDIDGLDPQALHCCLFDGDTLAGYSRIFTPGIKFDDASVGRIVLAADYRGKGLGRDLIRFSMDELRRVCGDVPVRIEAQQHLRGFYESLGFIVVSEPYDWGGIPHLKMVKQAAI